MTEAVIVSTARTPLCKSWRGALNMTHGAKMGGHVVHAALDRAEAGDGRGRAGFHRIGDGDESRERAVHRDVHRRAARRCEALHVGVLDVQGHTPW